MVSPRKKISLIHFFKRTNSFLNNIENVVYNFFTILR
jgi:hypothetical protein